METKEFIIIKKIAKHGNQAIIVVPKMLSVDLQPGTIVKLTINILEEKIKCVQ